MKVCIDIETNGLLMDATNVWVVVCKNIDIGKDAILKDTPEDRSKLQLILDKATQIIGHNLIMYDLNVLNKLWGITYDINKCFDTLLVSRFLLPDRDGGHSLKAWGNRLGKAKLEFTDFSIYSEEMVTYCKQDVDVTEELYHLLNREIVVYQPKVERAFEIEHQFTEVIARQVQSGFLLDINKTELLYNELEKESVEIHNTLLQILPKQKVLTHYNTIVKKNQLLSECAESYTYCNLKGKVSTKEFEFIDTNPTSRQQIAKILQAKGWIPKVFTETGLPKIDGLILRDLVYPEAQLLARLFDIQKQMGMIKDGDNGWLKCIDKNTGRIHGDVHTNATNTGRCSHSKPNLAQVSKKDLRMREVWIAEAGYKLVGVDASGLELRLLGHYLSRYDKGLYAWEAAQPKDICDIHTKNKDAMGLQSRDSAKTAIYGLVYGAGNKKLGRICLKDRGETSEDERLLTKLGSQLRTSVEENITGYKELLKSIGQTYNARGYLVGVDGRPLHPRSDYSALNLLVQSAGAIVCKQWVINWDKELALLGYKYGLDYKWVVSVHDEQICECKESISEEVNQASYRAMSKVAEQLNLKCKLDVEGKIGNNWKEVH